MRHLIVSCDGTWNTPEIASVTNVRRLHNALDDKDEDGNRQLGYYQPGVGSSGGLVGRLLGGGAGVGLERQVQDAYHWLTTRYEPGDRIALFGFSRGAYTVRSLAGMVAACGLIETNGLSEAMTWKKIDQIYRRRYRARRKGDTGWRRGLSFRFDPDDKAGFPVHFIGVWDTVGALGVPDYLGWLNLLDRSSRHDFHDLTLNPYVRHARHALAMDERRGPYAPTLWTEPAPKRGVGPKQVVKQVWFPGSHMDVGGGHLQRGLSDCSLQWMIDEAREAVNLGFRKTTIDQIRPDPLDVLHDDDRAMFGLLEPLVDPVLRPWLEVFLAPQPRAVPLIDPYDRDPVLHESVYERHQNAPITSGPYRPTVVLAPGESKTVAVFSYNPWNETGLYLEEGEYEFVAVGEWTDRGIPSGPAGTTGLRQFNPMTEGLRILGTFIGYSEKFFRKVSGNEAAKPIGSRRETDLPWMSLVGVVANNAVPVRKALRTHERIAIGGGTVHRVTKSGYLYAFANDAWGFYGNNEGSVRLTVTRKS
ncbi:DUF2235 domain-containing protein [Thermomonospora amylolytica]|uniref:DUF2235 domain-containing protein n=1 Tax=Thermomonospora amylolytica TaxID=1411117 RepID=UPI000E6C6B8A|nr:DUF2235 domain-containing protein [Thermomonospora amylolytica]